MVSIEAKKRIQAEKALTQKDYFAPVEDKFKEVAEKGMSLLAAGAKANFIQNSRFNTVSAAGNLVATVAEGRANELLDTLEDFRNSIYKERLGFVAGVLNNARGVGQMLNALMMGTKHNESTRKHIITTTAKAFLTGFKDSGKELTEGNKKAITKVLLRTGAHVLVSDFTMTGLHALLTNKATRESAIADHESKLSIFGVVKEDFLFQAKALAYFRVTGEQKSPSGMLNAGNIARGYGTDREGFLTESQAKDAEVILDSLVTLYALSYSDHSDLSAVGALLASENGRTDGNGIESALAIHKMLDKQAKDSIFSGKSTLMGKGYTPEIYNPHIAIQVVNEEQGKILVEEHGYTKGAAVERDAADPHSKLKHIYTLPDGAVTEYLSGAVSLRSETAKGSVKHNGNMDVLDPIGAKNFKLQQQITRNKVTALRRMIKANPNFNPAKAKNNHMTPVLNESGTAVNWRYMMHETTKDEVLKRDNRPENILGSLAGGIFDKEASPKQNTKVFEALYTHYQDNYTKRSSSFKEISANSSDPEMREIYRMLPQKAKDDIRSIWGRDALFVPVQLLDATFGYHKQTISSPFLKEEADRSAREQMLVSGVESVMRFYAKNFKQMTTVEAERFSKLAGVKLRKSERIWQEMMKMTKDVIVVRTGMVMVGNIASNLSLLEIQGVPTKDIVQHHYVAMKAGTAYLEDSSELAQLKIKQQSGFTQGKDYEIQQEILRLEDAIARNPVKPLIDAGLMPTIVEDIGEDDDPYSFKTAFNRKVEKYTDKINPTVKNIAKGVVVAQDTKLYKKLSQITQLSDFVARYTMYQHLTTRKLDPMSHEDAVFEASEAFINYDIPMHRDMQYMDDIGLTMFTKYFLGIQRVLVRIVKDKPLRVLMALALHNYYHAFPIVFDSSAVAKIGNNPLNWGAFQLPFLGDDLMTTKAAMSLIK